MIEDESESCHWVENEYGRELRQKVCEFERKLQGMLLDWFEKFLDHCGDKWVIVYRPHPGISEGKKVCEASERIDGLYYISDLSGQQWIMTADKISLSFSTMIAEAYAANKIPAILRPFEVPAISDPIYYQNINDNGYVSTYEEFEKTVLNNDNLPDISSLSRYYDVMDEPSYIRAVNELEKIYNSNRYNAVWDKADLLFVKKESIRRRIKILPEIFFCEIKCIIKQVMRDVHKFYEPRTYVGKKYMEKAENRAIHDRKLKMKIRKILKDING